MSRGAEKVSIRQLDPALVAAETRRIGGIVDEPRGIVENAASPLRIVIVDEGLPSDDLDPPRSLEILASEAAPLLEIDEFEHDGAVLFIEQMIRVRAHCDIGLLSELPSLLLC